MWNYKEIYMPSHPKARSNGCVLEHRLVAEKILGRMLKDEEVVHHIDEDRTNNSEDNLIVFISQDDHARFHRTSVMIKNDDGTYYAPVIMTKCETCGKDMEYIKDIKYCSRKCNGISNRKVERPSKEELYFMIKNQPFSKIAEKYGVSDNAVRRWCKSYNLPYRKKDLI